MESKRRVHGTAQRQKTELCVRGSVLVQPDVYADPYDQVADVARLGHHRVKTLAIHEVLELVAVVEQREDHMPCCSGVEISVMIRKTLQLTDPAPRPWIALEIMSISIDWDAPHRTQPRQNTARATSTTGFLPQHSAVLPQIGITEAWARVNAVPTQVAALALSVNWVDMVESATVTTVWSRAARKIAITRPPMISLRSIWGDILGLKDF
ncbi:hypothetical protein KL929_003096 [Ogataea haglerorum]|nr:hypothetical protein KL929_003096 [Ogataea haglerorum]